MYQSLCAFKYIFYVSVKIFFTKQRFLFSGIHLKLLKWCYQLVWKKKDCLCVWMLFKSRQIPIKDAIFWPTWVHSELSTVGPSTGLKFRAHLGAAVLGSPLCGLSTLSRAPEWSHVHTLGAALWWGKLCICVLAFHPHVNSVLDHWKKKNLLPTPVSVFTEISFCNMKGVQLQ